MPDIRALLAVSLLLVACASCAGKHADPQPGGAPASSVSIPSVSTSPTPAVPSYLASYTQDERKAYDDAVVAYASINKRNRGLLAAGKTTKAASDFYHRYSIDWARDWWNLALLANNHVTVVGPTTVVWSRPVRISLPPDSVSVAVLRQCLDQTRLVVKQNGKQLAQPQFKRNHVYRVRLERLAGETWWRSGIAKRGASC